MKANPDTWYQDIIEMHRTFGHTEVFNKIAEDEEHLGRLLRFRLEFIGEEYHELLKAYEGKDAEGIVDALVDLMVVIIGTFHCMAVDADDAWDEVHNANMRKVSGTNPSRPNELGLPDLVKPDGWEPPDHEHHVTRSRIPMALEGAGHGGPLPYPTLKNGNVSMRVLMECIELQDRKGRDYQSDGSGIRQADHYFHGIDTILDMIHQKHLRAMSISHVMKDGAFEVQYEGLEDTMKDMINYASFVVSYLRYSMDGQKPGRDIFNREV